MTELDASEVAEISGALSATAQRLHLTAGTLRAQANELADVVHKLLARQKTLRRNADLIDERANELDAIWKGLNT